MPEFWISPATTWLPIPMIHIRSQVMRRQSQIIDYKKLPKISIFKFCKKLYTWHTFWSCLIRCINTKWIQPELWPLQGGHRMQDGQMDRRTDRWMDGLTEWNPATTLLCGGIIIAIKMFHQKQQAFISPESHLIVSTWMELCNHSNPGLSGIIPNLAFLVGGDKSLIRAQGNHSPVHAGFKGTCISMKTGKAWLWG